jgi:ribosomal subunit interface protein
MQLSISGKHLDIGDSLRGHVTSALDDATRHYFGRAIEGSVVFQHTRHVFRADISLRVARGLVLKSHGEATDAYRAFDAADERLRKRMRRRKRLLVSRRRRPSADAIRAGGER